jgi:CRP-like cAMP-binding protein
VCISEKHTIEFERGADMRHSARTSCGVRHIEAGQHLFYEGADRSHIFVIETGWVKLYRTLIDGQRQVVGFCNGGSVLGLDGGGDHANSCEAITEVTVRVIAQSQMPDLCRRDPELAADLLRQMGRQLGSAQSHLTTIGAQTADQKLATFLLAFADCDGEDVCEFDLPMRRTDIGEFLGLRLETISRKLTEFQRRGWVKMVSMYRCRLLDRDALEHLAEGGDIDELSLTALRH